MLVTAGLATLAYGISQTEAAGWTATATLVPLVAGLALIGLFLAVEARTAAPLMPLGLLARRPVSSANVSMFLCGSSMFCRRFFMTLYAQNVLGCTPLEAGLARRGGSGPVDARTGLCGLAQGRLGRRTGGVRTARDDTDLQAGAIPLEPDTDGPQRLVIGQVAKSAQQVPCRWEDGSATEVSRAPEGEVVSTDEELIRSAGGSPVDWFVCLAPKGTSYESSGVTKW